jgi:hypothetical protein
MLTITATPAMDAIRDALNDDPWYTVATGGDPSPYDARALTLVQDGIPQPGGRLLDVWQTGSDLAGITYLPGQGRRDPRPATIHATYTAAKETTRC